MLGRFLLLALLCAACRGAPQLAEDVFLPYVEMRSQAIEARLNWGTKLDRRFMDKKAEITAHLTAKPQTMSDVVRMIEKDRELHGDLAELLTDAADTSAKCDRQITACGPVFSHLYGQFR